MVIKGNRKGDVTITTVILIVLGLVVLVMMIIGFTKGSDFLFGWFDRAPSELQTLASACVIYAQGGLSIDFCNYNLIGSELVNCRDERIMDSLKADGVNVPSSLACTDTDGSKMRAACNNRDLVPEGKLEVVKLNGKACKDIIAGKCESVPNGCQGLEESICKSLDTKGCTWTSPSCAGTRSDCSTVGGDNCRNGCEWKSP